MKKFLTTLIILVVTAVTLSAYAFLPQQWPQGITSIPFYVNPTNTSGLAEADVVRIVQTMAEVWNGASNVDLVYQGTTTLSGFNADGNNVVFFTPDPTGGNLAADTYRWWDGSGRVYDMDMGLFEGSYQWYLAESGACAVPGLYLDNTVVHEFGHMLGLAHSEVAEATMYSVTYQCNVNGTTLDADDVAGIQALYPATPPPPTTQLSVRAYKVKGVRYAELTWSGLNGVSVDVYRGGAKLITTANDGAHVDPFGGKGSGSMTYQVCEANTATCSNVATANW